MMHIQILPHQLDDSKISYAGMAVRKIHDKLDKKK